MQSMILDSFMTGFLFKLYMDKWKAFARRTHYVLLCITLAFTLSLIMLSTRPSELDEPLGTRSPAKTAALVLAVVVPYVVSDLLQEFVICLRVARVVLWIEADVVIGRNPWEGLAGTRCVVLCLVALRYVVLCCTFYA